MNGLIELLAPMVEMIVHNVLKSVLSAFVEKQPTHARVVLATMYPGVDAELEPLVEGTPTKLDDAVITAVKKAIEDVATAYAIPLSNVDAD